MTVNVLAAPVAASPHASRRSLRGLDWFVFFVADVQTGFGPFVSVYLITATYEDEMTQDQVRETEEEEAMTTR